MNDLKYWTIMFMGGIISIISLFINNDFMFVIGLTMLWTLIIIRLIEIMEELLK